jgi:hypothetical protein
MAKICAVDRQRSVCAIAVNDQCPVRVLKMNATTCPSSGLTRRTTGTSEPKREVISIGPGGKSVVNGVVPNCFSPAKIVDPGGSLVNTTWPPLAIAATATIGVTSNVNLMSLLEITVLFLGLVVSATDV